MTTAAEKKPDAKPEAHNINISLPQYIYDKIVELAKADDRTPPHGCGGTSRRATKTPSSVNPSSPTPSPTL